MPCGSTTGSVSKRLNAISPAPSIEWMTGWLSCAGLDFISAVINGRACTSNHLEIQLVQQVAKVRTDNPEQSVAKGSVQTPSSGVFSYPTGVLDISADTDEAAFVRWGVIYKYAGGQSPASGDIELNVAYTRCGEVVGAGTWQLDSTTTAVQYVPIAGWLPALLVDKVKLAAIVTNLSGNLQWRLVYRTAATSTSVPGSWTDVTDGDAPYTSGEVNTGDLAVSLGTVMWVQLGIAYNLSSGGTGQASIAAALSTRRS